MSESGQSHFLLLKFSFVQIRTRKCEVGFKPQPTSKMLHTNQAELNQLYGTFCRVWAAGGQATLTTSSLGGKVTAKLELELGQPTDTRPGAPPLHLRTGRAFPSQRGAPASGAARRPCHRGPAAKAKSRARAAAHQAAKAAAASASKPESTLATPAPGAASSTPAPNVPLSTPAAPLFTVEASNAPAPGATLPPLSAASAGLPPAPGGLFPSLSFSPAPSGANLPPFDPEEEEEEEDLELPCAVCVLARLLRGTSVPDAPMSSVADIFLNKTEHLGDPFGLLASILYCDEHRVTVM